MPVADRDSAGLVEQHHVDIARRFHRLAAFGDDVGLQRAIHARDTDGGQQSADGRGNQADQQCNQGRYVGAKAMQRSAEAQVARHVLLRRCKPSATAG